MTSWLDIVLSHFLYIANDSFHEFWNIDCYLLAYSFFQLGDSFWDYLSILFPNGIESFPWNRFLRSNMNEKKIHCLDIQWNNFENQDENFSEDASGFDAA